MNQTPFSLIHVGFSNTGTTSLQLNFFSKRTDIFYVGEPYNERGGIFSNLRYLEDFKYDEPAVFRYCNEQIFSIAEGRPIVVSDETLCDSAQLYYTPYSVARDVIALRLFRLFQPAKIIFTIRRQENYVCSMYMNLKRNSAFFSQMPVPPLSRWYRGMLSQLRCHYLQNINFHEAISMYQNLFGRQNVLVLPLERLILDGPKPYLQDLCSFAGLDLSDDDVDRFAQPRNVRMSQTRNLAAELLTDDRFCTFYSRLEQDFGRERLDEFLDQGDRAAAALDDADLADLSDRVASGNRLLAEEYDLDLERYGYAVAAKASPSPVRFNVEGARGPKTASRGQLEQLQSIIDMQRRAQASQIADMQGTFAAEREAAVARIRELEGTLKAEHEAFVARIRELEAMLAAERRAQADQIAEMQGTFAAEREAAVARIRELEGTLKAEHEAFVARIRDLEALIEVERRAQADQIAEMQGTFAAEREAAVARIRELEGTLKAEHDAFVARIRELEGTLKAEHEAFVARIRELEATVEAEHSAEASQVAKMQDDPRGALANLLQRVLPGQRRQQ